MSFDIHVIKQSDDLYPPLLREIHDPPEQLYIRGNAKLLSYPHLLAVVGSRKASWYGRHAVDKLLPQAVRSGIVIVSGMAYGIDALGHRICVENSKPTIAVMATGVDDASLYPQANLRLAHAILDNSGALISEYPPGTAALLHHFPARNRIIAGVSKAVLVIQAAHRSGSLITARLGLEANRDVCAVPGSITDLLSEGTNHLIQQGATPILAPEDLTQLYGIAAQQQAQPEQRLPPEQAVVFSYLSHEPQHVDQLIVRIEMSPQKISALLLELELQGHVKHIGGMRYIRNP